MVPSVEINGIAGQETAHELFQLDAFGEKQQMEMVGNNCPSQAVGICLLQEAGEALHKELPVSIIAENVPTLNPPDNNMLQQAWYVESRLTWHGSNVTRTFSSNN